MGQESIGINASKEGKREKKFSILKTLNGYKQLDFTDSSKTEEILSFLREIDNQLFLVFDDVENKHDALITTKNTLHSIVDELSNKIQNPNNIFLVDMYTRNLIKDLKKESSSTDVDIESFKISPNQYAKFIHNKLSISNLKDKGKLEPLVLFENKLTNKKEDKASLDEIREYFFQVGTSKRKRVDSEIEELLVPISASDLSPINNNISDEDLSNFNLFQRTGIRGIFEKEFKIPLSSLYLPEQFYVFNYFKKITNKEIENVTEFSKKFGTIGLRTFLSIEQGGPQMGDKILELGEKLPEEVANKVFGKYAEIVDSTNDVVNMLTNRFGKEEDQELILKINESLLKKGKDLLLESASNLDKCEGEECKEEGIKIEEKLSHINKGNILLGSTYKELLKKENIKIDEIKDVSIEMINSKEGISKYKQELIRIFRDNRESYPEKLLKESMAEFTNVLENPDNREFYILKNKEEILAFMRFDILENGDYYAGSLNGRNEIQGLALGGSFLKQLLVNKSRERNIQAIVYEKNQMLSRYANEFGFKIVGEIEDYKGTGQKFYKLEIKKGSLES